MKKTNNRQVWTGVCLVLAAVLIMGLCAYRQFYHHDYQFPFSADEVESLTIYDRRFLEKKEITRREDIAGFMDIVEGATLQITSGRSGLPRNYLCFNLKDGSRRPYCVEGSFTLFTDGTVCLSGRADFDYASYWDRMSYEVQEGIGAELAEIMMMFRPDA